MRVLAMLFLLVACGGSDVRSDEPEPQAEQAQAEPASMRSRSWGADPGEPAEPQDALPVCHVSCCSPDLREPGPDGTIECCFCEDDVY